MTKPVVQFRLRRDLYDMVKRMANDNGRSLSNQIEYMLDGYRENSIKDDLILAVRQEIANAMPQQITTWPLISVTTYAPPDVPATISGLQYAASY